MFLVGPTIAPETRRHFLAIETTMFKTLTATVLVLLGAAQVLAATLSGQVTDKDSAHPLPGANIAIMELDRATTTDMQGRYRLSRVPPGQYHLRISLVGYDAAERHLVVTAADSLQLDIEIAANPIHLGEMLIRAERSFSAASSRAVRDFDLQMRPRVSAHQMLQMAPGLIIAQHAGGGKAEQIFLRNFDADHGTDVAVTVDGMPVNMVSHGHGQGYADLHFLIPELVEELEVDKGPYFARHGNLATAGAIRFRTKSHLQNNLIRVQGGSAGTAQFTTLYQLPLADPDNTAYFAGNYYRTDGPVDAPQGLQRVNVFAKIHTHLSEHSNLTLDVGGFSSAWNASGQIPARAIDSIGRWGSLDPLEGGTTGRQTLNLTYRARGQDGGDFTLRSYYNRYDFKLFSNFTFYLNDPVAGDMIEQTDDRALFGIDNEYSFHHAWGDVLAHSTLGGGLRSDNADVALWKSPARSRQQALVDARVLERNLYLWAQEQLLLTDQLRLILGLRGDYFTFSVEDHLERVEATLPHASGYAQQSILSPKASLVWSPLSTLDLYVNGGTGFHSNDARNVILDRRAADLARTWRTEGLGEADIHEQLQSRNLDPGHLDAGTLPRAIGAEFGTRVRLPGGLNVGAAAWWLDLEEEFVYVGDGGMTERSGATRRMGIDLETRARLLDWLWLDLDATLSTGQLTDEPDGADHIPLAPTLTSQGGLTMRRAAGTSGSLRFRHIGDRPANEVDSVTAWGYTVVDLSMSQDWHAWRVHVDIENLLDSSWNEAQFDTESRLRDETESVTELHLTPGNPRGARLGISLLF